MDKKTERLHDWRDLFLSSSPCKPRKLNDHRCQLKAKGEFLQIYRLGEAGRRASSFGKQQVCELRMFLGGSGCIRRGNSEAFIERE